MIENPPIENHTAAAPDAPATPRPPRLRGAVNALMAEAEQLTAEITGLRQTLELAEQKRRKLVTALDSAVHALPSHNHADFATGWSVWPTP